MSDKKLTDNEIIKALECCSKLAKRCTECPFLIAGGCAQINKAEIYLDLINRLQAKIKELKYKVKKWKENYESSQVVVGDFRQALNEQAKELKTDKAEAYKECIEKAKEVTEKEKPYNYGNFIYLLNNLLKELVGDTDA